MGGEGGAGSCDGSAGNRWLDEGEQGLLYGGEVG